MLIEKVDPISFEALQGGLGMSLNRFRTAVHAIGRLAAFEPKLRRDHNFVAERRKSFADNLFVDVGAVRLRGIEECNPAVECCADKSNSRFLVNSWSQTKTDAHAA